MVKGQMISFKADEEYLGKIDALCQVLNVDRSKAIRFALDEAIKNNVDELHRGEIIIVDTKTMDFMNKLFDDFMKRKKAERDEID